MGKTKESAEKKSPKSESKKSELGLQAEKDELSEWYTELLQKAELIEYSMVSGCYILRPRVYAIWEKVQAYFDHKIKRDGVKNCYFPLFIPESLLLKEKEHVEGFSPEVAWVTHTGDTPLNEKLAVRPTSESIMYATYAKWIRSWRDLPLKLNQWCNVVRWEFKHPLPLLRSREFLWQEGHTAFSSPKEAEEEAYKIQQYYADVFKEMYALPVLKGRKTEKEKFAGAHYTLTTEAFLPSGKSAQAATSHHLGQNFSKAFGIKFKTKDQKEEFVWQNSWGISTRSIGIAIMMHSDNKGLILPPKVASPQVILIPIFKTDEEKMQVMKEAENIKELLPQSIEFEIDARDQTPGFKFNDAELKGIPLRIELGPRDVKAKQAVIVRRDQQGMKETIAINELKKEIPMLLEEMQQSLYSKAERHLKDSTVIAKTLDEIKTAIANKRLVKTPWCGNQECEDIVKSETGGAKMICILEDEKPGKDHCPICKSASRHIVAIAKSY